MGHLHFDVTAGSFGISVFLAVKYTVYTRLLSPLFLPMLNLNRDKTVPMPFPNYTAALPFCSFQQMPRALSKPDSTPHNVAHFTKSSHTRPTPLDQHWRTSAHPIAH